MTLLEEAEVAYRQQVVDRYGHTNVNGFASSKLLLSVIPLEQVFVLLTLVKESLKRVSALTEATSLSREREVIVHEPIALDQALHDHILLVGEPGAGKSTLLHWLLITFAQGLQRDPTRIGLTADADRLPVLIELGRLPSDYLTGDSRHLPDWSVLLSEEINRQAHFRDIPDELFRHALNTGRCLLLFDGLDEIANRQARARLAQSLAQIPHRYPGNRIVVSSRPTGLTNESEGRCNSHFSVA